MDLRRPRIYPHITNMVFSCFWHVVFHITCAVSCGSFMGRSWPQIWWQDCQVRCQLSSPRADLLQVRLWTCLPWHSTWHECGTISTIYIHIYIYIYIYIYTFPNNVIDYTVRLLKHNHRSLPLHESKIQFGRRLGAHYTGPYILNENT